MSWNNGFEKRKFEREWAKNEDFYRKEGMTDEQIAEIRKYDEEIYNSNRRFFERTQEISSSGFDDDEDDDSKSCLLEKFSEPMSVSLEDDELHFSRYWWIEEIEDSVLAVRLKQLSNDEKELLTLLIFDELSQREIATAQNVVKQAINNKFTRIKKYLKKS